ncbi:unnamed protein product [Lymnaea stagnalis]|uniref:Cysteine and tyrosine-rich protein 1 n=1 Tax=Lymnaea stagnalis TaxID=6523 RepID=A0AAV2IJG4_LYMST
MAVSVNKGLNTVVFLLYSLISGCVGGESCYDFTTFTYNYCAGECCSYDRSQCCSVRVNIGLVTGLSIGGIILVVIIAVSACICRRRYYSGVIVHTQPAQPSVVVAQSTTTNQSGMMATGGYQPGYNPQPYGAYPQYPQGYPAAGYAQGPPSYDAASHREGGRVNPGYKG